MVVSPSLDEINRISSMVDPVIRNLQITQCYHELSAVLARRTGMSANWCTFATWASKQAGQSIRREDLLRFVEARLRDGLKEYVQGDDALASLLLEIASQAIPFHELVLQATNLSNAIRLSSAAVGRGNQKVFEEIGREFARFYAERLGDEAPDEEKIALFCAGLRPGEPPEGQEHLRQAFRQYYRALFETDAKARAEFLLLANIEIGFHEQTRLQPEIAESLEAGLVSALDFTRRLIKELFPYGGLIALGRLYLMRLLGRPTRLDQAIRRLLERAQLLLRQALTDMLMTLNLPGDQQLRLGQDLGPGFPASLQVITNPVLKALLERVDPTADSTTASGAQDWASLPDRLHFIVDLFRCYQEQAILFEPPFDAEQVRAIKRGEQPVGRF
jgi:hypothetical protein